MLYKRIFRTYLLQMYYFLIKMLWLQTEKSHKMSKIKYKNENRGSEEYIISVYYTINFIISPLFHFTSFGPLPVFIYFTIKPSILVLLDSLSRYFLSVVTISQHDCRSVSVAFVSVLAPSLPSLPEIGGSGESPTSIIPGSRL